MLELLKEESQKKDKRGKEEERECQSPERIAQQIDMLLNVFSKMVDKM